MAVALKEGALVRGAEAIAERPDGTRRWFTPYPTPLHDPAGRIVGGINMLVDITERKRTEEALQEADRRKDEFLATLAHELRNPLAPLANGLQLMRLVKDDPEALERFRSMMERQLGQMVRLVDDLLDVSRISRGKTELRKERIGLAKVVEQAIETCGPLLDASGHELTVRLPPDPILLDADATRLTQAICNLLNNAGKFTSRGGRILLAVERQDAQAVIRVRDTGLGIAPDQLSRIFDLFAQVDTSLERTRSGLGIGLTLVKNIVEMHGGTVQAHSDGIGQGSEFVVRVPVPAEASEPALPQPSPREPAVHTPARRILVVDDNHDSAASLAMLLKLAGNETRTAHDGLQAVEAAAAFKPEVILLDIGLPKLNGYDAARRIRERSGSNGTVLVALTGWGQDRDRQMSKEAGFDAHLVKPVDLAALKQLLASLPEPQP
jgi:signal transduction histidine kinase/CheY-like chemotaxis protein